MDQHIRLSAIEFCDKSRWHEDECAISRLGAAGVYELDADTGLEALRITSVSVNGKKLDVKTKGDGLRLIASRSTESFFVVKAPDLIQINPAPASSDVIQVIAAFRPTIEATSLDDSLSEWREAIAGGAIARIIAIPSQSFSNPDLALYHGGMFKQGVQTALVKQGMGSSQFKQHRQILTF